jgi:hypothetical protein
VAEIWRFKFYGFFAWWLWRTIYLFKLPGLERKVRVAMDWTLDLFFRRDIVLLKVFMKKVNRGKSAAGLVSETDTRGTLTERCQDDLPEKEPRAV